jgi:hypothetical protein
VRRWVIRDGPLFFERETHRRNIAKVLLLVKKVI